jgi:hypothetical protein
MFLNNIPLRLGSLLISGLITKPGSQNPHRQCKPKGSSKPLTVAHQKAAYGHRTQTTAARQDPI